jgi:hypothetical protein
LEIKIVDYPTEQDWIRMRNNALFTQRKSSDKSVSSKLKTKFLLSEHSPIYTIRWTVEFYDIPYWTSNQIVRSHEGFTPFVSSQRNDIQYKYDRRKAPQDANVNLRFDGNAEAIITISKKRLCLTASSETRVIWEKFIDELKKVSLELANLCVKPCVYRNGICPEVFSDCKYNCTKKFIKEVEEYRNIFESCKTIKQILEKENK